MDISSAGKTPWIKALSGKFIGSSILPDINKNGVGELSINIETIPSAVTNSAITDSDESIYAYDANTGASVATPQKYIIER